MPPKEADAAVARTDRMSHIAQRFERALRTYLIAATNDDSKQAALITSAGEIIVTDEGLTLVTTTGSRFDVNFYVGQSDDEQKLPKVVATCVSCQQTGDPGSFNCMGRLSVVFEADATSTVGSQADAMEEVSQAICESLESSRLVDELSYRELGFSALGWTERVSCDRSVEGRKQIHTYSISLVCVGKYLEP